LTKLGGWWRVWLVVSLLWLLAVTLLADWKPTGGEIIKSWKYGQPTISEVNAARADFCTSELAILYNFTGATESLIMPTIVSQAGDKIVELQCDRRYGFLAMLLRNLAIILSLPVFLLVVAQTGRWVFRGFRPSS
jgi:hypothetical protein